MTAMALAPDAAIYPLLLNVSVACFAPVVLKRMTEITCVSAHVPNSVSVDYRSALRIDCPDRVEYGGWGGADGNRSDPAASSAVPICELSNRARSDVVQADTSTCEVRTEAHLPPTTAPVALRVGQSSVPVLMPSSRVGRSSLTPRAACQLILPCSGCTSGGLAADLAISMRSA